MSANDLIYPGYLIFYWRRTNLSFEVFSNVSSGNLYFIPLYHQYPLPKYPQSHPSINSPIPHSSLTPLSRTAPSSAPEKKFCSARCRRTRPSRSPNSAETRIEETFIAILSGDGAAAGGRRVVECGVVEREVFGEGRGSEADDGDGEGEGSGVAELCNINTDNSDDGGVSISPPPSTHTQSTKPTDSQQAGMQRARNRELVRQAARRMVAFGVDVEERVGLGKEGKGKGRKVEAVQGGRVVESSFAKGEWGVRWKE